MLAPSVSSSPAPPQADAVRSTAWGRGKGRVGEEQHGIEFGGMI